MTCTEGSKIDKPPLIKVNFNSTLPTEPLIKVNVIQNHPNVPKTDFDKELREMLEKFRDEESEAGKN